MTSKKDLGDKNQDSVQFTLGILLFFTYTKRRIFTLKIFCMTVHFRYMLGKIKSFYRGVQTCSNSGKSLWSTGTVFVIFCMYRDFLKEKQ